MGGCAANLSEMRRLIEAVVLGQGFDGVGEQGLDLFPIKTPVNYEILQGWFRPDLYGGYAFSPCSPGTCWANWDWYVRALLYPGPDGPVATERFEMFREGLQLTEAILFLQRAVAEKKLSPALEKRAGAVLAERPKIDADLRMNNFFYRCFQSEADAKLLDMAGDVARELEGK